MFGHLGFSYVGLIYLLMLFIPNIIWSKNQPVDSNDIQENKILLLFERVGQMFCTFSVLIFSDFNIQQLSIWSLWLIGSFLLMLVYEICWIRYFHNKHTEENFYNSFCYIPIPLASLPVTAFLLLGIYGQVVFLIVSTIILGIGHMGIHIQHLKGIKKYYYLEEYNMKSKFIISTDGAKIAYNVFGKGFPLVLVHGMGSNKEMWIDRKWIEIFENYFTVITIDIRGNGESDKSYNSNFYSINNIIDDINLIVKECGFNDYNYFGHSYGATIGLQLCKQTNNIKKVVCGGTTFGNKFFKEIVPEWIEEYESLGLKKKNNTLNELKLSVEDIDWIEQTDIDLVVAELKAWNYWEGVDIKDIKTNLAVYSGTKDNPQVLENLNTNKIEIQKNNIDLKIFENLNHTELVSNVNIVSPWVLDFLLK